MTDSTSKRPLSSSTGVDALLKQVADMDRWQNRLANDLRASTALKKLVDQKEASVRATEMVVPSSIARLLDDEKKMWRNARGPLEQLRAATIVNRYLDEAAGAVRLIGPLDDQAKKWIQSNEALVASTRKVFEDVDAVTKSLFASLNTDRLAQVSIAAQPFARVVAVLERDRARMRLTADDFAKNLEWTKKFSIPVIDSAAAAAVARTWGAGGLLQQVRSLGLDQSIIEALIRGASPQASDAEAVESRRHGDAPIEIVGISLWNWLSILSVLLGILVPIWQKMDSDATEARLTAEIRDAHERNSERVEALVRVVESMVKRSNATAAKRVLVARSRVAFVRRAGKSGSAVLAEVFPNQVVELVSDDGKWIQVRYFDWMAHEEKVGWVLKKYFTRVLASDQSAATHGSESLR